jgi:hypothetical protein
LLPNLIGSFLLPFGACWFFQRYFKLQTPAHLSFTCCFGLLLVIINEYLQLIPVFGRTFDYLDIFSSVVGVFCGHLVFARRLMYITDFKDWTGSVNDEILKMIRSFFFTG